MRKTTAFILIFILLAGFMPSYAYSENALDSVCAEIFRDTPEPTVGYVGGEWAVIALSRSGYDVDGGYYEGYVKNAAAFIEQGDARRYTDYARVTLALSALGYNSAAAEYLRDFEKVVSQGINGAIYALIALDSRDYTCDEREEYLSFILERQHEDGGFGLTDDSDVDITAMALQAIAKYTDKENVLSAVLKAEDYISKCEITSAESASQVIIAMCALGENFDKYETELMDFYTDGGFEHEKGDGKNAMATEQAACALAAIKRRDEGKNFIYDMTDITEKNSGTYFLDADANDMKYLGLLRENDVMGGRSNVTFDPDGLITRAEFSSIVIRAARYKNISAAEGENHFSDVPENAWYSDYAAKAAANGLILGVSDTEFLPDGELTREMAMVIMTRLCALCGEDTAVSNVKEVLDVFSDEDSISQWAREGVAFCVKGGYFLSNPICCDKSITRIETARILTEILWND